MKICFISLFPETIAEYMNAGMMRKASEIGATEFIYLNLRDFGLGPRRQVDDNPYGGGSGMVLKVEPLVAAIQKAKELVGEDALVLLPTPRGEMYTQEVAKELAGLSSFSPSPQSSPEGEAVKNLIIICPRYEGYDERIVKLIDRQICIGNYVLTGGEIPAMLAADSVVRLLPGVLGGDESVEKESFQNNLSLIEHPQYTRPEVFDGESVPEVLLGGNHAEIEKWRDENSEEV
jgi:tRNA (guanine37-N1)-methyltransferase